MPQQADDPIYKRFRPDKAHFRIGPRQCRQMLAAAKTDLKTKICRGRSMINTKHVYQASLGVRTGGHFKPGQYLVKTALHRLTERPALAPAIKPKRLGVAVHRFYNLKPTVC